MKEFVLDCSVTMSWFLEDEQSDLGDSVLESLSSSHEVVPPIWPYEIANVLAVCERRSRLAETDFHPLLRQLANLPITVISQPRVVVLGEALTIARELSVKAYDAAYLELAQRLSLLMATLDQTLAKHARGLGITVLS